MVATNNPLYKNLPTIEASVTTANLDKWLIAIQLRVQIIEEQSTAKDLKILELEKK